jgi:dTDP-L-rhamnose 4-epimerase
VFEIQPPPGFHGPLKWLPTDERIANPQNQYGISKIAQEKVALHLGRRYGIPSVAMRYSIVQGPRQSFFNAYSGACRVFCLAFHQGAEPTIYEDGQQVRDFVNIHDVVDANLTALHDERCDFEMFHVGGGKPYSVAEFAMIVGRSFGRDDYLPSPSGKYRFGDTRHICSDISKLTLLGWKPRRSVGQSVEAYKGWLQDAACTADILAHCSRQMVAMNVVRTVAV